LPGSSVGVSITFRKLQYQTGLLISGFSALEFLDCTVYSSALDLYVDLDRSSAVIDFLQEIGYDSDIEETGEVNV
jgi:hypothetical protein